MNFRSGIKISLWGTGVEAIGMVLDIMHHINIGIKSSEGLLTPYHAIIFIGFIINFIGVLGTLLASTKGRASSSGQLFR